MSKRSLEFSRVNAWRYQREMVKALIDDHQDKLQVMQKEFDQQQAMRSVVAEHTEVWSAMTAILKPFPSVGGSEKLILLQKQLIKFLQLKQSALDYLISDQQRPEVWLWGQLVK